MSYQLPEPSSYVRAETATTRWRSQSITDPDDGNASPLFTADQVLAAYLAGIEEAAKACERVNQDHGEHPEMALTCAEGIRALAADGLVERKG